VAWLLTFVAVVVAWVFFRAESFATAGTMLYGMAGLNGVSLPNALVARLGPDMAALLAALGVRTHLGGGWTFVFNWLWVSMLLMLVLVAPNTIQLTRSYRPTIDRFGDAAAYAVQPLHQCIPSLRWQPNRVWAAAISVIAAMGILGLGSVSEFLYFQF
jgi:hypothetical protein